MVHIDTFRHTPPRPQILVFFSGPGDARAGARTQKLAGGSPAYLISGHYAVLLDCVQADDDDVCMDLPPHTPSSEKV